MSWEMILFASLMIAVAPPATSGLSPALVAESRSAIAGCGGSWTSHGKAGRRERAAADLLPALAAAAKPASQLSEEEAGDLYLAGKALLRPAIDPPAWVLDPTSWVTCRPRSDLGVAILSYLAGDGPQTLVGPPNAYDWLGLAHAHGAGVPRDGAKARIFYLKSAMRGFSRNGQPWFDGKDRDLLANIDRAGLRPWLTTLAGGDRGSGKARVILADEALATDPARARRLLLHKDFNALNRLLELEAQGRIEALRDGSDAAVWSAGWAAMPWQQKLAARIVRSATLANGAVPAVLTDRPGRAALLPVLARDGLAEAPGSDRPIPLRALVAPSGKALLVEPCQAAPATERLMPNEVNILREAARRFPLDKLPPLAQPGTRFGWVLLPQVQIERAEGAAVATVRLVEADAAQCRYSALTGPGGEDLTIPLPPPTAPAPRPRAW